MIDESEPMTPLDVMPLHGFPNPPGYRWACSTPERPDDGYVAYDVRCERCVLAAEATLHIQGDRTVIHRHRARDDRYVRLSDLVRTGWDDS